MFHLSINSILFIPVGQTKHTKSIIGIKSNKHNIQILRYLSEYIDQASSASLYSIPLLKCPRV